MKYLIKPTTTDEFWDIPAVLLTITDEQASRLEELSELVVATCKQIGANRITFHDEIISLTAIENFIEAGDVEQFFEDADDYGFVKVRDDFDPNDHKTWRTDGHLLSIHDDGEIWFTLHNHWGGGELEIRLPEELYTAAAPA